MPFLHSREVEKSILKCYNKSTTLYLDNSIGGVDNMDKAGYKAYLQSLGNQQHYIGRIEDLWELEQELNINLDDYIPYDGDYRKVSALDTILPEEERYNEKLEFLINSYIRYRLSEFGEKEKAQTNKELICDDFFTFHGTESELKERLFSFMSEEDSQTFINGIQDYLQYLGEDEYIEKTSSVTKTDSDNNSKMLHLLVQSSNYNINIKALTLTAIALLLDIKITLGWVSATLAILGFNNQAIVRVDVSEGEKCLILEAMQSKNRVINEDVFSVCNFECVHNDLNCKYQDDDKCTISKEDIKDVLDGLCDKNIFKKIGNLYKYNF